jgi:hypothetical protein
VSGSLRGANLQRRLSGDESGEVSVATRPRPGIRTSPKPPLSTGVFCEFRCHEAAVRDLTTPATSRHWPPDPDSGHPGESVCSLPM